jgi:hypothetical protein
MNWQEERERLLADTVAFVQQALGQSLVLAVKSKIPLSPEIETAAMQFRRHHAEPKPTQLADLRQELGALFEALHNMQPALHRRQRADHQAASTA